MIQRIRIISSSSSKLIPILSYEYSLIETLLLSTSILKPIKNHIKTSSHVLGRLNNKYSVRDR